MLAAVRLALRRLARDPGFSAAAILLLTLGLGLNTGLFSVVRSTLIRPLPWAQSPDLVRVYLIERERGFAGALSLAEVRELGSVEGLFRDAAFHGDVPILSLLENGVATPVIGEILSEGFFEFLELPPELGRNFPAGEEELSSTPTAMLSYRAWLGRFGADPAILGRHLLVNGSAVEVIGVASRSFRGTSVGFDSEILLPWSVGRRLEPSLAAAEQRGSRELFLIGRLREGLGMEEAATILATLTTRLAADHPEIMENRELVAYRAADVRVHPSIDAALVPVGGFLMAVAALLLAVASANLGGLMLARGAARRQEMNVRAALGAPRRRLIAQMLGESVVLAVPGGLLGVALAAVVGRLLSAFPPPLPVPVELDTGVSLASWLFALVVSAVVGVLLGVAPALEATRPAAGAELRGGSSARVAGGSAWFRRVLIAGQVAASSLLILLAVSALRSVANSRAVDLGYDVERTAGVHVDPVLGGLDGVESRRFLLRTLAVMGRHPEVSSAALSSRVPFGMLGSQSSTLLLGGDDAPRLEVESSLVSGEIFATLGQELLAGRTFDVGDDEAAAAVGVVNTALAERLREEVGSTEILGRLLRQADSDVPVRVIGIVASANYQRAGRQPRPHLYRPWTQSEPGSMAVVMRASGESPAALPEIGRRVVDEIDGRVPVLEARTLAENVSLMLYPARMTAGLLGMVGGLALVIAALGLWGAVAYSGVLRRRELAVRAALGADQRRLSTLMLRESLGVTLVGVAMGGAATTLLLRPLRSVFFGLSPSDLPMFLAVAALLSGIALLAAYVPARRAAVADPLTALRDG